MYEYAAKYQYFVYSVNKYSIISSVTSIYYNIKVLLNNRAGDQHITNVYIFLGNKFIAHFQRG